MLIPDFLYPLVQSALLLLCGYKSFKAIDTKETKDDIKWLTFWLVYSVLAFAKSILDMVSILIPLYNELNLAAIVYLAFFGGAQLAFDLLRPLIKQHESIIDAKLNEARSATQGAVDQAQAAVNKNLNKKQG